MKPLEIIILRSQDILSDSRVLRYEEWYKKNDITYRIIGWNRKGKQLKRENTEYYTGVAGFQQGTKGIVGRIKWNYFLLRYLLAHREEYRVIHACDFDTVMPSLFMKCFGKKVIFDIFDWFSDEVKTGKWYIDMLINLLERTSVKLSDLVIICERGRLKQMKVIPRKWLVIPNVSSFTDSPSVVANNFSHDTDAIKIVYIGGLVEHRGLCELVDVVPLFPKIKFVIAGYGSESISDYIKEAASQYNNLEFLGKVDYKTALNVMSQADLLYAMYYTENPNHKYAAPNKFYESIFLHKPIVTTQGTLVGEMAENNHSGFVIGEGKDNLEKFFSKLSIENIKKVESEMPACSEFMKSVHCSLNTYKQFLR